MQRLLIDLANGLVLVFVLIGVPAVTSLRFGKLQFSSTPEAQMLTLWGLGLGALANVICALGLAKKGRTRDLCCKWVLAYAALFVIEYSFYHGYLRFHWLKTLLLSIRKMFRPLS